MTSTSNRIKFSIYSILLLIFIILFIYNNNKEKKSHEQMIGGINLLVITAIEKGYASGQADALNGRLNIRKINDSVYIWIKSPWRNRKPSNDTIKYIHK